MKKLDERSEWEKEWESAFNGASLPPSENVWNGIDGALDRQEVRKYKKRALFYQWVAAASVLLVMGLGGWLMLGELVKQNQGQLATEEPFIPSVNDTGIIEGKEIPQQAPNEIAAAAGSGEEDTVLIPASEVAVAFEGGEISQKNVENSASAYADEESAVGADKSFSTTIPYLFNSSASLAEAIVNKALSTFRAPSDRESSLIALARGKDFIEEGLAGPLEVSVRKVWVASEMFREKEEDLSAPRYWLGASLASNLYQPNFENGEYTSFESLAVKEAEPTKGNQISTARVSEWKEDEEQQISINAGFQAAAWLSEKWVLQSGLQYGSYRSTATAGTFVDGSTGQAYPLHYANFSYDKLQKASVSSRLAAPVEAVNSFEFISVPLQIGYVVFDRQFGLLLSPGLSSEFFIRNQITDENDRLSTFTVNAGKDAPFNRVHFNAIMGAQLYYKLGENYMISLEPSFRQAISSFSKSDSYFNSRPSNIGVAAGFRYIIR